MAKGGEWERKVAKLLSKWLTGKEKPYQYWRMPASGGLATIHKDNMELTGDIMALTPEAEFLVNKFCIECKAGYKEASFDKHFKYNKSDPLKSFWTQVSNDSVKSGKRPMLIYKKKGLPTPWVGIGPGTYFCLQDSLRNIRFIHIGWGTQSLSDIWFFEMKEFFDLITPEYVKELVWQK